MRVDQHTHLTPFTSSRDDAEPFIGLRVEHTGGVRIDLSVSFSMEQMDTLIKQLTEAREYVVEFERRRHEPRNIKAA